MSVLAVAWYTAAVTPAQENTLFHGLGGPSPLGQITLMASIADGRGIAPAAPYRVYGSYALVIITRGQGSYQDANGYSADVRAGDAIFVHPTLPHTYGPDAGQTWDEFFLVFSGPAFDAWHAMGLFDPKAPLYSLDPLGEWLARFRALSDAPDLTTPSAKALQVCRLLALLTEIVLSRPPHPAAPAPNLWLAQACSLLGGSLGTGADLTGLIRPLGMPYETFRRRFTREMGIAPARFRAERTVEAACHLLQYTGMTGAQIAERLGYGDEYHFSRRFKQLRGETPTQFRRSLLR